MSSTPTDKLARVDGTTVVTEMTSIADHLFERIKGIPKEEQALKFAIQAIAIGVLYEKMVEHIGPHLKEEYKQHVDVLKKHIQSEIQFKTDHLN